MLEISFHQAAEEEMNAAAAYYAAQHDGLSEAFLAEVSIGLQQIQRWPLAWSVLADDFRRYLLHRFPYGLIYRIADDHIFILAVAHLRRKPGYWIRRTKEDERRIPRNY